VAETWEPARFVAELRKTKWFQTHSEAARNATILRTTDPKTWAAKTNQATAVIKDMAVKMGAQLSDETLRRIVNNVLTFGWNDAQIQDTLAGSIKMGSQDTYGGQAAVNAETLRALAMNNGVKIGDKQLREWLVRIGAGEDISGFEAYVRKMAAGVFPGFEQEITNGMNVRDLADPYIQQMAQTLELSPDSLDLFDPTIRKALQTTDPASGKLMAKPMWQFEQELKQDPRWLQTDNARETLDHTTRNILNMWGVVS
jgi:uncharacterized protein YneF (UPF0154 family)